MLLAKPATRWQLVAGQVLRRAGVRGVPGCPFRRPDVAGAGLAHRGLEHDLLVVRSRSSWSSSRSSTASRSCSPWSRGARSPASSAPRCSGFWRGAINYGVVMARAARSPVSASRHVGLVELAYWISPKPIDAGLILFNALDAATISRSRRSSSSWKPGRLLPAAVDPLLAPVHRRAFGRLRPSA